MGGDSPLNTETSNVQGMPEPQMRHEKPSALALHSAEARFGWQWHLSVFSIPHLEVLMMYVFTDYRKVCVDGAK